MLTPHSPAHLELLTFLSDESAAARQVALQNLVGFSAAGSAQRSLLTEKHKGLDGQPLRGRDGEVCDTIEDLKRLCADQPITAHDAFSALINLSDSLLVSRRIADDDFLTFLVRYIAEPISLLADLASMLLSNLTKLESISARLLSLQVTNVSLHAQPSESLLAGIDADPSSESYEADRAAALRAAEEMKGVRVPALARLLDAFEQGAMVKGNSGVEEIRKRALAAQKVGEEEGKNGTKERKSNCHFLSSVFANVTVIPAGRDWFVSPLAPDAFAARSSSSAPAVGVEYPVARIMPYTEHPDLIRRGGAISALKNILFLKSSHKLLLAPPPPRADEEPLLAGALRATTRPDSPLDILPHLLLPLCEGRELSSVDLDEQEALPEACQMLDEDKLRERDPALRAMLVESLLLLCTTLYGRQVMRSRGVYVVVRAMHLKEDQEKIAEEVLRLVNILQRDESETTANETEEEEGKGDEDVGAVEETDEDLVIEEL